MNEHNVNEEMRIRRFSNLRIAEHWIHVLLFASLILTGLSQTYYFLGFSEWFVLKLGGIDNVRALHRVSGILFSALLLLHILVAVSGVALRKWRPDMLISKKDYKDAVHNIKYYFGLEGRPARCGRYTYKQKFEYWSILLGVILMTISGYTLMYPITATAYVPGEIIPVAKVLHSNEAIVMILIISIWHIYNAIFSPEVFPLDRTIFTGYISMKRMVNEHPLELQRAETDENAHDKDTKGSKIDTGEPLKQI